MDGHCDFQAIVKPYRDHDKSGSRMKWGQPRGALARTMQLEWGEHTPSVIIRCVSFSTSRPRAFAGLEHCQVPAG